MAYSKYTSTKQTTNAARVSRLLLDPCTDMLRDVLRHYIPETSFLGKLQSQTLTIKPLLNASQRDILYPRKGTFTGSYQDFNISLLYLLLRNISRINQHAKGWGKTPSPQDRSISANIERIRNIRNIYIGHHDQSSMSDSQFNSIWQEVRNITSELVKDVGLATDYVKLIDRLQHETMDPELEQAYLQKLDDTQQTVAKLQDMNDGMQPDTGQDLEEEQKVIQQQLSNMTDPLVSEVESRSALIQLEPPEYDHPAFRMSGIDPPDFRYNLLLSDKGKEGKYHLIYSGDATEIIFKDLKPATDYHIRVYTSLDDLKGNSTEAVKFTTNACEPDSPQPPKLSAKTKTAIILEWHSTGENGAKISSYTLEIDKEGSGEFVEVYIGSQRRARISKLQAFTKYTFRLAAINSIGKSQFSDPVSFFTSGSVPSQPDPPILSESYITALTLSWIKRPNENSFLLQMEDEITGRGFIPVYNGVNLSYKVEYLRQNTEYKFRLAAINDEGKSKWSDVVSYRTKPDQPGNIPDTVQNLGPGFIKRFLGYLEKGEKKVFHAQGLIVGCANAGKTTLLKRLKGEEIDNVQSTLCLEIHESVFTVDENGLLVNNDITENQRFFSVSSADIPKDNYMSNSNQDAQVADVDDPPMPQSTSVGTLLDEREKEGSSFEKMEKRYVIVKPLLDPVTVTANKNYSIDDILEKYLTHETNQVKTISFLDFAGQCAYYAGHQIFMRQKSFFILVCDMSKNLDDIVDENICSQKGTYFASWKYKDYVIFWFKLIHCNSGPDAPVLLVATHAEGKSEKAIDDFFQEIYDLLKKENKDLLKHIPRDHKDHEFAISLKDEFHKFEDVCTKLKTEIIKLAKRNYYWGISLPASWVVLEDALDKAKQKTKITSVKELWRSVENFKAFLGMEDYKEFEDFLDFSHENGNILHFKEDGLSHIIILDAEFVVEVFRLIMADKNHLRKDLDRGKREYLDLLQESGMLKEQILDELWKNDETVKQYKEELLAYMERLGILASVRRLDESKEAHRMWYVPCMNKEQFNYEELIEMFSSTSVLCFQFNFLPVFVFYKLVVACMSIEEWKYANEGDKLPWIYQSAAMFDFEDHKVIIGVSNKNIEVQILRPEEICEKEVIQVRQTIEEKIEKIKQTFHTNLTFDIGFKCHQNGFCDESVSFLSESDCEKPKKMCPKCPRNKFHPVDMKAITQWWKKQSDRKDMDSVSSPYKSTAFRKQNLHTQDIILADMKSAVSNSVGRIIIENGKSGTGFRVGDKYIMTNNHIIKDNTELTADGLKLKDGAIIRFQEKKFMQTTIPENEYSVHPIVPYFNTALDVAVLELRPHPFHDVAFPQPLTVFGNINYSNDICFVGHPGAIQMKEDTVKPMKRDNETNLLIKRLEEYSVKELPPGNINYYEELNNKTRVIFHTAFTQGSSGSPGIQFTKHKPCVVTIMSGGMPSCLYEGIKYVPTDKTLEVGIIMKEIRLDMEHNNPALAANIFTEWVN